MFRRHVIAVVAASLITGASVLSLAQESQPATQAPSASSSDKQGHGKHGKQDPAERVQKLSKKLNLSSEQQTKVQGILESQQQQMQSLRQDTSLSAQDRKAKAADLRQSTSSQIRAVLNADQQKKFDQMEQKHKQRMAKHTKKNDSQSMR
jgi:protein CpxP